MDERAISAGDSWLPRAQLKPHATRLFQERKEIGNAHIGQLLGDHVPKDDIVHRTCIFSRLPLSRADDGIGSFVGGINDCLNVLFVHERVIGCASGLFRFSRNRLLKV